MSVLGCRPKSAHLAVLLVATVVASTLSAAQARQPQQPRDDQRHAGYVDPAPFSDLVDQDPQMQVVEVVVEGPMLRAVTRSFEAENAPAELVSFLKDLRLINSLIITPKVPAKLEPFVAEIDKQQKRLEEAGWMRLAHLRTQEFETWILAHSTADEDIDGLVVMTLEQGQFVFSNLAGKIDLATLGRLPALGIPIGRIPEDLDQQNTNANQSKKPTPEPEAQEPEPRHTDQQDADSNRSANPQGGHP